MDKIVNKKVLDTVDVFKFIAAIMVVAIHTHPFAGTPIDYFFTSFCRVAVPFFFIANSYFFFLHEKPNIRKYNERLITLYVIWFIIELPIVYYRFFVQFDHSFPLQVLFFIRSLFFNNTFGASWFIMACIISVNLIYYLSKKTNNTIILCVSVFFYILSLISSSYYHLVDEYLSENMKFCHKAFAQIFMPANSFMVALIYGILGKIVAEKKYVVVSVSQLHVSLLLLLVTILGGVEVFITKDFAQTNDAFLFLPVFTVLLFILLMRFHMGINEYVSKYLREMSILVYLLHPMFVIYASILSRNESVEGGMFFGVILAISLICSTAIIALSPKWPQLKKLY